MALEFKNVKEKLETTPLTNEELEIISEVERFIDDKIESNFDNRPLYFNLSIVQFQLGLNGRILIIKQTRRNLMYKELENRYLKAGWKVSIDDDQGNQDWILKGE